MPSPFDRAQSYFGIPNDFRTANDFFPQDTPQQAKLRNTLEGRAQTPQSQNDDFDDQDWQLAQQTGDPFNVFKAAQEMRAASQSQKVMSGLSRINVRSPSVLDDVNSLVASNPLSINDPTIQNYMRFLASSAADSRRAREEGYNTSATKATKQFLAIPEDDPQYPEKFSNFIQNLDEDTLNSPRFSSLIERGQHNSAVMRSKRTADQQQKSILEKEARRLGIKSSQFDNPDDLNDAIADQMAKNGQRKDFYEFFQRNPEFRKEYAGAMSGLRAPTSGPEWDQEKADVMGKEIKQMTPQDWTLADPLAKQRRLQKVRSLNDQMSLMGVNPLGGFGQESPSPQGAPAAPSPMMASTSLPRELLPEGAAGLAPVAQPNPEDFTAVGAPVAPPTSVAQAVSAPKQPGFGGLKQQEDISKLQKAEEEAKRTAEQQRIAQANNPLWENAKQELLQQFKPEYSRWSPSEYPMLASTLGKKANEKAFDDASGNPVSWGQVVSALMSDPRMESIRKNKELPVAPQKLASGKTIDLPGGVTITKH